MVVSGVVVDLGEVPEVLCHPGDINQALLNLVVNAAHAVAERNGDGLMRLPGGCSTRSSLPSGSARGPAKGSRLPTP